MRGAAVFLVSLLASILVSCNHSDEMIARNIQRKAAADPEIQVSQLVVVARDGKVTLKGRAKTEAARARIQELARTEPGVWTVDDQIVADTERISVRDAPVRDVPVRNASPPAMTSGVRSRPAATKVVVVPKGTVFAIRTKQALGSKTSHVGTSFKGALARPISSRGNLIIPSGSAVMGSVKEIRQPGLIKGKAVLVLGLDAITVAGETYSIASEVTEYGLDENDVGRAKDKRDVNLPTESALNFRLAQPLKVRTVTQR